MRRKVFRRPPELYDKCTFEAKKIIAAQFVKAVHIKRDYEIDVEFIVN